MKTVGKDAEHTQQLEIKTKKPVLSRLVIMKNKSEHHSTP